MMLSQWAGANTWFSLILTGTTFYWSDQDLAIWLGPQSRGGSFISVILFGLNNVGVTTPLNTSNTLNLKDVYNFLYLMDFLQASLRVLNLPNCLSPGQRLVLTLVYNLYFFCIFIVTANECTNVMLRKDTLRHFFMLSFVAWPDILQCPLLEDVFISYHNNKRTERWSFFRQWDDDEEKARKLALTWANHFLFSHSCSEVQCLYSDHRRSKMHCEQMLWGNRSQKSLAKTYFNFISFLPQRDIVTMFSLPMASIEYLRAPRGSQSSNHRTVWNAQDVLITIFFLLFQKYKQLHLNTSASLEIRLMPFQLSCARLDNRSEAESGARKKKRGGGGGVTHVCLSFHLTSITQHKQVLLVRCFLHGNLHLVCTNIRYSHSTASILNIFSAADRTLFCLDQMSRSRYATYYLWVKFNVATGKMQKGGWDCSVKRVIMQ